MELRDEIHEIVDSIPEYKLHCVKEYLSIVASPKSLLETETAIEVKVDPLPIQTQKTIITLWLLLLAVTLYLAL